jgi:hypothetical protein
MDALSNELGKMESLRMLDLTACYELKKVPPYVIQRLSQLEELFIDFLSLNLSELNSLPCLVMLSLKLVLVRLPQGFVFPNIQRYYISINHPSSFKFFDNYNPRSFDSRILVIKYINDSSLNTIKVLFRTVEYISIISCEMECIVDTTGGNHTVTFANLVQLYLHDMSRLRSICEGPNQYVIFNNLTVLVANGCTRLISLFSPSAAQSLKKLKILHLEHYNELKQIISEGMILESRSQPICLPKLETIQVLHCGKLEYVLPLSVARNLLQLESLELKDLPQLKQVFGHEKEGDVGDGNNNVLFKLRKLRLENLPELGSLHPGNTSLVWLSLENLKVVNCPKMKSSFFFFFLCGSECGSSRKGIFLILFILFYLGFFNFLTKSYAPGFE